LNRIVQIDLQMPWTLDGVRIACAALTTANLLMLRQARRAGKPYPQLYNSGVRYIRARELGAPAARFVPIPVIMLSKGSNCGPLACWRAAELQERGERARAVPVRINPRLMHVVVRRGDGRYEDPSRLLGM
jgi:hypothetical protein